MRPSLYLLFFVAVTPQMGQLAFQVSSSSARSGYILFSMGQRYTLFPQGVLAAVSLFAFLGELYVNVSLGPAHPRLLGTVRRRFAYVFHLSFYFLYYLLLLFLCIFFSRRDVEECV